MKYLLPIALFMCHSCEDELADCYETICYGPDNTDCYESPVADSGCFPMNANLNE